MNTRPVLKLKKIQDMGISKGSTVLVRVDYNVPMKDGKVSDDTRIRETEKTIKYLLTRDAKIVLISHLGRPKGKIEPKYSLKPLVEYVEKIMGAKTYFVEDCIGQSCESAKSNLKNGEILLCENLRYHPEEEKNDESFAKELAKGCDYFVQDAFGAIHRAHASTSAITKYLPCGIGFLLQKELEYLEKIMTNPQRPFVAIIGGAKVSDKIEVLNSLLDRVDALIIGGAMAYTFLKAQDVNVGNSLVENDKIEEAKKIILKAFRNGVELILPSDHIVVKEVKEDSEFQNTQSMAIPDGWIGVDIGERTISIFAEKILQAKTIFWNGPVGIFEMDRFARGSIEIARIVAQATKSGAISVIGGGDTLNALKKSGVKSEEVSHCSTGGGASLEFVEGKLLPGLEALSR
ncbi:MAG: phosphoglycerate kinase [Elusimicrobiales bacterium]|nr:phosphoglycerate kinase [Elusimicrobiales bacterium]